MNALRSELRGIFPIVYTPFDESGDIVERDLRRLVDHLIACGAHGLAGVGGGSECHKLTIEEREWMCEVIIDQAHARVPVIVGTSAENTRTAVRLSSHAQQAGASAVFLTPPTSGPSSTHSNRSHYGAVAQSVSIPVMIQHALIPISVREMVDLAVEFANICYIKEEAANISGHMISEILRLSKGQLKVFSGGTYLLDDLARGVVGAIPGSICVADLARAYDLSTRCDYQGARAAYNHCLPLLYARYQAPFIWAKEVLRRQGIFEHACMREPAQETLDEHDLQELDAVMQLMGPPY